MLHSRTAGRWLLAALSFGAGCGTASPSEEVAKLSFDIAPTAVIVPLGREHVGILDESMKYPELLCLQSPDPTTIYVEIVIDEEDVEGQVALVTGEGVPLDGGTFNSSDINPIELRARTQGGSPAACVHLRITRGVSVYRMSWSKEK